MGKKHKRVLKMLNYTEHSLILAGTATGCFFIFYICFFDCIYAGTTSCFRNKNCAIIQEIIKYKSTIKNTRRNMIT